ncbi:MAG: metal-binding protein [Rhizobiales bacterium NRL2]|nr:MAG: metal-binding protein [Rhizobiales bacterium NRL2]
MRKIISAALFGLALAVAAPAFADQPSRDVTLYKAPQCGCCGGYADYLRQNGFEVTVKPTHELPQMSRLAGIPENFEGCHLSMIDNYVVSGHVPVATVERLLSEKPKIAGITLPGMPQGSPGMSGVKTQPFTIYEIGPVPPTVYAVE